MILLLHQPNPQNNGTDGAPALKPAHEDWILLRKPLEGTVAQNVLKWGVGGINIDGCRIDEKTGAEKQW